MKIKRPLDPPPSERQKDETIDEILERIKKVWPKDDIYTTKGSAGASDDKLPSGEGKTDPSPDGTSIQTLPLEMNSPDPGVGPEQMEVKQVEMLLHPHLLTGHCPHFPQSYNLFQEIRLEDLGRVSS